MLEKLLSRIEEWQRIWDSYTTRVLAGYLYYINRDFEKARDKFIHALTICPEDIDTWAALAFSLNHIGDTLGLEILFNHDLIIKEAIFSRDKGVTLKNIRSWAQKARENNPN